jgi:hypothetical protein
MPRTRTPQRLNVSQQRLVLEGPQCQNHFTLPAPNILRCLGLKADNSPLVNAKVKTGSITPLPHTSKST